MSKTAIAKEFDRPVTVLKWTTPGKAAPVGLVQFDDTQDFCVVELDAEGFLPFFEDFSSDEEAEASRHYKERVNVLKARTNGRFQDAFSDMLDGIFAKAEDDGEDLRAY